MKEVEEHGIGIFLLVLCYERSACERYENCGFFEVVRKVVREAFWCDVGRGRWQWSWMMVLRGDERCDSMVVLVWKWDGVKVSQSCGRDAWCEKNEAKVVVQDGLSEENRCLERNGRNQRWKGEPRRKIQWLLSLLRFDVGRMNVGVERWYETWRESGWGGLVRGQSGSGGLSAIMEDKG